MKDNCFLCGNVAEKSIPDAYKDEYLVECDTCKTYIYDGIFKKSYVNMARDERAMISAYTRECFELGLEPPLLKDPDELKGIIAKNKNRSLEDKISSLIFYIKKKSKKFGDGVYWDVKTDYPIAYCSDSDEFFRLILLAKERNLLIWRAKGCGLELSGDGWQMGELFERKAQMSKEADRQRFLAKLNEISKSDVNEFVDTMRIANELGISRSDAFSFVRYYDQKSCVELRTDAGDTISITAKGIDETERNNGGVKMNKRAILEKLEELYSQKEVKTGFPSKEACIEWSNKIVPLLKYNENYYREFVFSAQALSLNLSSFTTEPAFRNMLNQVQMAIEELKLAVEGSQELQSSDASAYANENRIAELKDIPKKEFDLSRLIRLLEETNICFRNQCYTAVALLIRAIIDHVPPIFRVKTFGEIANNYAGSKSFKESMDHLEKSSRKIADQQIHCQIRKSEVLPNRTQVDFKNDMDVLLSEIVRILK